VQRGWAARDYWRDSLLRRMLSLADVGVALAVAASFGLFGPGLPTAAWSVVFVPVWILAAKLCGLYDRDHRTLRHLTVDEMPTILVWGISCVAALTLLLQATPAGGVDPGTAIRALVVVLGGGLAFRSLARFAWRRLTPPERTIVIGSGRPTDAIRRKLELFSDIHVSVVGEVEDVTPEDLRAGGAWAARADRLILATTWIDEQLIGELVAFCRRERVKLSVVPPARGMFGTAVWLKHIADLPVVEYNTWDVSRSTMMLKRVLDVVVSGLTLLLTAPLFAATALAIRLTSGSPVFFVQTRAGLGGREFRMLKFRTMRRDAEAALPKLVPFDSLDEPVFKLSRDPRVTRLGQLLRRMSLDELPQLLNVLKGDMSLVGPRPEQIELVERYAEQHRIRLAVKPGMTGPMQVYGRGELTFEERLAVEREYVENISLGRDLRILALTVASVVSGRGAF
jgi:exopolysaccharide biosynthesis polyprenyl glycosylphosphotransferase